MYIVVQLADYRCKFCEDAKSLLSSNSKKYFVIELAKHSEDYNLLKILVSDFKQQEIDRLTVPQIFYDSENNEYKNIKDLSDKKDVLYYIGGFDDLKDKIS